MRNEEKSGFDKHDRVNYAVTNATVKVNVQKRSITLNLQIDEDRKYAVLSHFYGKKPHIFVAMTCDIG